MQSYRRTLRRYRIDDQGRARHRLPVWHSFAVAALAALLSGLAACAPLIGPHSPQAYENATNLKAETLALMGHASEPYVGHQAEVAQLNLAIDKAYEYVHGVPSNDLSARQWDILRRADGDLLGRFLRRWKEDGTLSPAYIEQFKRVIGEGYDEIICLEANKKEAKQCVGTNTP